MMITSLFEMSRTHNEVLAIVSAERSRNLCGVFLYMTNSLVFEYIYSRIISKSLPCLAFSIIKPFLKGISGRDVSLPNMCQFVRHETELDCEEGIQFLVFC